MEEPLPISNICESKGSVKEGNLSVDEKDLSRSEEPETSYVFSELSTSSPTTPRSDGTSVSGKYFLFLITNIY